MTFTPQKRTSSIPQGFTLVELIVVIAIVLILVAGATIAFNRFSQSGERAEAAVIKSTLASLKSISAQAALRLNVKPNQVDTAKVVKLVDMSNGAQLSGSGAGAYTLSFIKSGRRASFQVQTNGATQITSLQGFSSYTICGMAGDDICEGSASPSKG